MKLKGGKMQGRQLREKEEKRLGINLVWSNRNQCVNVVCLLMNYISSSPILLGSCNCSVYPLVVTVLAVKLE